MKTWVGLLVVAGGAVSFAPVAQAAGIEPAVKNFRQVFQSMVSATGIAGDSTAIASYWAEGAGRLPQNGEVGEVNTPALLTMQNVASLFCKEMIAKDAGLNPANRQAHRQVDFRLLPKGLSLAVRESVIEEYGAMFWGRAPDAVERILLLEALDQIVAQLPSTTVGTRQMFLLGCTMMGSSVDSLTF